MGVLDFLFQGSPPPSTTTYGTTVSNIPQFMSDYTLGLLNKASSVAAEPYQAYQGPRLAEPTPEQERAYSQTAASVGQFQPNFTAATNLATQAGGANIPGAAAPYMGVAGSYNPYQAGIGNIQAASGMNPMMAALPFALNAAQSTPSMMANYMNPYTSSVVDRIGQLAGRNLQENLMPAINTNFIRAGQFGSTGQQGAIGKALRDVQESALAAQAQALQQGYTNAQTAAQTDLARQLQLAQQQGNLALGTQQQLGQLGTAAGNLAQASMSGFGNLAQLAGNQAQQQAQQQLAAAGQLSALGQTGQAMNLKDLAALEAVGQTQQQEAQKNLDLAYRDFLSQRQYPQQQLSMLNALIRGLPYSQTVESAQTGTAPAYQPSPLSQLAGAFSLGNAFKNVQFKEGGQVKRNPNRRSSRGKKRR